MLLAFGTRLAIKLLVELISPMLVVTSQPRTRVRKVTRLLQNPEKLRVSKKKEILL
jgi:hypothetical protein